jgi:hypothetical protein
MLIGEINLVLISFLVLLVGLLLNVNSFLHLLLMAELVWVTLYGLALLGGFLMNDIGLLSLTFFFLIFSAIELGIGLELISLQNVVVRSLSITSPTAPQRGNTRFGARLYTSRLR